MTDAYEQLKLEMNAELKNVLDYWVNNTLDQEHGGFVGKIDHFNTIVPQASKGIILNTRILWSFSAASNYVQNDTYRPICDRAFHYLQDHFKDKTHGGVFWELNYMGNPVNRRKQIYAQAFAIYALSEYYQFTQNEEAKNWALEIFHCIEKYAKDTSNLGYFEAFNEDWSPIEDMRLSEKDMNTSKTMNTHLHLLEAYTALLKVYDDTLLRDSLKMLVELFLQKFLNNENHYELFFDDSWNLLSNSVSYGHDIETAWLVIEAAKLLNDEGLLQEANSAALKVADTFLTEGIDEEGAVLNEENRDTGHVDTDRHWWPQVEALVGLKYAYELQPSTNYIKASLKIWDYVKKHLIDHKNGEWFFRVSKTGAVYTEEDKVSMWKAPYHTSRACIIMNT